MSDNKENLRAVPADQRSVGPNETMIISSTPAKGAKTTEARRQPTVVKGTPRLVGRGDPIAGQIFQLKPDKTTVGRSSSNDIVINDGTISARHAQIVQENGTWRVINLISTNGTSVNGQTNIVSYLAPGDVVSFGRVEAVFEAQSERASSAAGGASNVSKNILPIVGGVIALIALIGIGYLMFV